MEITMINRKLLISLPIFTLLIGCASGPNEKELANADYGRSMSPQECVAIAESLISRSLKDPSSAQYNHAQCFMGYGSSVPIMGLKVAFGWVQNGQFNAKNSFGGYVGFQRYSMIIKNGKAIRYCTYDKNNACIPKIR